MKKIINKLLLPAFLLSYHLQAVAAPWFTGPLLAPAGKTVPLGHANLEVYGFDTQRNSVYGHDGETIKVPSLTNLQGNPVLTYGLADWVDVQLSIPYSKVSSEGRSGQHIGDTSILMGFQALRQKEGSYIPDIRVTLQEVFPTGRFDGLNPIDKGTGISGSGAYQTGVGLVFQELTQFSDIHYLRTRFATSFLYANAHQVNGSSGIGGNDTTHGNLDPGNAFNADLAGEFSLTQHWVAVMEGYYLYRQSSAFHGATGFDLDGNENTLSLADFSEFSLAPAIEYNFNANYGIIAGGWFAVQGRNAPIFRSAVIAFNAFW